MLERWLKEFYGEINVTKAVIFTALFLIFKISFPFDNGIVYLAINEILVIHAAYFWLNWFVNNIILSKKNILPLLNSALVTLVVLLLLIFGISFVLPKSFTVRVGFFQRFVILALASLAFGLILYAFAIIVKFYFYRQKGNPKGYYRAMLILLLISGLLEAFTPYFTREFNLKELFPALFSWIENFGTIVEIALILLLVLNSFRVAWIAKLTKKEKRGLIVRSFFLSLLYAVTLVLIHVGASDFYTDLFPAASSMKKVTYLYSPFVFTVASFILLYGMINSGIIFFTTIFHLPTAEESDKKTEELSMLWNLGKLINRILDVNELGEAIVLLAKQTGNTERVWVEIFETEKKVFISGKMDEETAKTVTTVLKRVGIKTETNVINVSERSDLGFLAQFDIERILIAPLKVEGRTKGFIFLARSFEEEGFDDDEIIAVSGLADYASLAISKAELLKASIEKERMEKELEVAREIQRKIIPERLPAFENFDVAAQFIPAFEVGGDYYDFFRLKNSIAFVLADVSGKGVEASYIMAEMKGIFEALAVTEDEIENLIVKANGLFEKRLKRKHFVTAVIGLIKNDAIVFYRIGHNKPILIDAERNAKFIESKGLAFGLTENKRFAENLEAEKIVLRTGESLVFYTDGVNEARNEKGEEFGYERFFDTLISNATKSAHETAIAVIKKVSVFASKNLQNDDITLLIFKKK